jgi:gas vesicle protein
MGRKNSSGTVKKFAIGAALAALAGYLTGLLTAPQSGKETRRDIKNTAVKGKTEAERELKKLHTELSELLSDAKGKSNDVSEKASKELTELVEKAKGAKEKARDVLSALHEGDAEDKELQKAIDDANKAVDHIRKFLKK